MQGAKCRDYYYWKIESIFL